jgi:CDP-paratose 2-epimerase
MRQSCIYGYRQFGVEDQGWVAWFVIAAVLGRPITIYGNGKQVRDVLFVEDLVDAYLAAAASPEKVAGKIFNVGGGPAFQMSIWSEFGPILEGLLGQAIPVAFSDWRPGDQPVYVSDIRKVREELGWAPRVGVEEGVGRLFQWVSANKHLFE